jgi:hypothetical protein
MMLARRNQVNFDFSQPDIRHRTPQPAWKSKNLEHSRPPI